jgi:hypothetical protein
VVLEQIRGVKRTPPAPHLSDEDLVNLLDGMNHWLALSLMRVRDGDFSSGTAYEVQCKAGMF